MSRFTGSEERLRQKQWSEGREQPASVAASGTAAVATSEPQLEKSQLQLLQAQAAIEKLTKLKGSGKCLWCGQAEHVKGCFMALDLSALRERDAEVSKSAVNHYIEVYQERNIAEVRKPLVAANLRLVDLLRRVAAHMRAHVTNEPLRKEVEAALAQAKERP